MSKKGVISGYLPWLLMAIAILAVLMIAILLLKDKAFSLLTQIKNILTGG